MISKFVVDMVVRGRTDSLGFKIGSMHRSYLEPTISTSYVPGPRCWPHIAPSSRPPSLESVSQYGGLRSKVEPSLYLLGPGLSGGGLSGCRKDMENFFGFFHWLQLQFELFVRLLLSFTMKSIVLANLILPTCFPLPEKGRRSVNWLSRRVGSLSFHPFSPVPKVELCVERVVFQNFSSSIFFGCETVVAQQKSVTVSEQYKFRSWLQLLSQVLLI